MYLNSMDQLWKYSEFQLVILNSSATLLTIRESYTYLFLAACENNNKIWDKAKSY
jgi:hypothetical protein